MPAAAVRFWLNDRLVEESSLPGTTTLLRYLRDHAGMPGTKEGCAEGDCGACAVVILEERPEGATFRAINSCLLFLPMLQGRRVYTVEALRERRPGAPDEEGYHPAQEAMVATRGSQCGYCTPGIVMSIFEACYRDDLREAWQIDDQLCGNLCRCTGYRPIRQAAEAVAGARPADRFRAEATHYLPGDPAVDLLGPRGRYTQPGSADELFAAIAERPQAVLVAGGTDLALRVTKRHEALDDVIGLDGVRELRELTIDDRGLQIGAGVSLTRVLEQAHGRLPALEKMLRVFGSRLIRSRATIGGNLVTCSPIGDLGPVLVALDATATVRSATSSRTMPVADFLAAYRRPDLRPGEVLWSIHVPWPQGFVASYKVSKRRELDISTASAGMAVTVTDGVVSAICLAYGGLSARPASRATRTEAALLGRPWTEASVDAALPLLDLDFSPIDDLRGTAAYRRLLAKNLLRGFFLDSQRPAAAQLTDDTTSPIAAGA